MNILNVCFVIYVKFRVETGLAPSSNHRLCVSASVTDLSISHRKFNLVWSFV